MKKLSEMTLEELWTLFPIILTKPDPRWRAWYQEEEALLCRELPEAYALRIHHIGSTAIHGIWAKPIVDILVEAAPGVPLAAADQALARAGFRYMSGGEERRSYNKGYTPQGFAERVFHLHLCHAGVQKELLFRDYLNVHPADAKAYEALKLSLWKPYEHDRDGYTAAKTSFVQDVLRRAGAGGIAPHELHGGHTMSYSKLLAEFLHPADAFSPMPFWFWNDALTEGEITRQMDDFQAHGIAGFVIHPRKGLPGSIPYLSDVYMHYVRHAVEEAARRGMQVVLYDEAMYPSGAAHGLVVQENPEWASRCLWMEQRHADVPVGDDIVAVCAARVEDGAASDVTLLSPAEGMYPVPADGRVLLVFREGFSGGTIRGVHEGEDDSEPNAPKSADLLNPEAVQAFIRITHERYYSVLAEHFGKTVIAMFTDEPDIKGRNSRWDAIAWTQGFLAEFGDAALLPYLFLNGNEDAKRHYRQAVNARMVRTYYQPLADWCGAHGVALTGHPAKGYDIGLLKPFQIPGQDVVWRFVDVEKGLHGEESVLGKCSADSARHRLRRRNANECFGCCGTKESQWAMTPGDMKWYMDYLFLRGVNLLYPHAFYYSTRDGRGDERPPDAGPNNAWWPEYGQISAYMRRLAWLMTDSVNQARVAVLCEGDRMDWQGVIRLYENQIEFNYLEAELLGDCRVEEGALCIARQRYTHVILGDVPLTAEQSAQLVPFVGGKLPRDLVTDAPAPDLRVSHVVKEGVHFYLLVNEGGEAIRTRVSVPVHGRAQWWNAWEGSIADAPAAEGAYPLTLGRRESIILCIDSDSEPVEAPAVEETSPVKVHPARWMLTREDGAAAELIPDEKGRIPGWETLPGWELFSGCVTYEAAVDFAPGTVIDLGEVHEIARVYADGTHIGTRLWGPYVFTLPRGAKNLRVEVANTPAGKMDGVKLPSGILG